MNGLIPTIDPSSAFSYCSIALRPDLNLFSSHDSRPPVCWTKRGRCDLTSIFAAATSYLSAKDCLGIRLSDDLQSHCYPSSQHLSYPFFKWRNLNYNIPPQIKTQLLSSPQNWFLFSFTILFFTFSNLQNAVLHVHTKIIFRRSRSALLSPIAINFVLWKLIFIENLCIPKRFLFALEFIRIHFDPFGFTLSVVFNSH